MFKFCSITPQAFEPRNNRIIVETRISLTSGYLQLHRWQIS